MLTECQFHDHCCSFKQHEEWKYVFWPALGVKNGARQQETRSGAYIVYPDQMRFLSSTNGITPTGCKRENETQQQQLEFADGFQFKRV